MFPDCCIASSSKLKHSFLQGGGRFTRLPKLSKLIRLRKLRKTQGSQDLKFKAVSALSSSLGKEAGGGWGNHPCSYDNPTNLEVTQQRWAMFQERHGAASLRKVSQILSKGRKRTGTGGEEMQISELLASWGKQSMLQKVSSCEASPGRRSHGRK